MKSILNLAQTTALLANPSKLSSRQLAYIRQQHQNNLARAGKIGTRNNQCLFVEARRPRHDDIRRNPALGKKHDGIRKGLVKASYSKFTLTDIDPDTGDAVPFSHVQRCKYYKFIKQGMSNKQAVIKVRQLSR